jgi:hypothetical protein
MKEIEKREMLILYDSTKIPLDILKSQIAIKKSTKNPLISSPHHQAYNCNYYFLFLKAIQPIAIIFTAFK